jgi:hypothetical protein
VPIAAAIREPFQHFRRDVDARGIQVLCRLREMRGALSRISARCSLVVSRLRIPSTPRHHLACMPLEPPGLLIFSLPAKLFETPLQPVHHRATRGRAIRPRLAGILGIRRTGDNQRSQQGNEEFCFHGTVSNRPTREKLHRHFAARRIARRDPPDVKAAPLAALGCARGARREI